MDKFFEMYGKRPGGHDGLPTMATRAQDTWDALRAAYDLGCDAEREECAKICELAVCMPYEQGTPERAAWNKGSVDCAEEIRAKTTPSNAVGKADVR